MGDPRSIASARAVCDQELLHQVLEGGLPGEHAALELLLRQRPRCWEDAVGLLHSDGAASRCALDALADAWRIYRRVEPAEHGGPR